MRNTEQTGAGAEQDEAPTSIDVMRIMELLPHRYPFLMIDKMVEMYPGRSAVGIKNVTINEQIFQGHFPGHPIFPGVLIVEAMAQTAAALVVHTLGSDSEGKLVYFMSLDNCRFRKPVGPGDTLRIEVTALRARGNVWKFHGDVKVDGQLVAEADYAAMIADK
jgi:3-hydroxyacyl-[acyl-carrier-protein] dehydratase